jgi:hypothetical protein
MCVYVMNVYTYYKIKIYKLDIRLFKVQVNLSNYSNNKH